MNRMHRQLTEEINSILQIVRLQAKALSPFEAYLPQGSSVDQVAGKGHIVLGASFDGEPCGLLLVTQEGDTIELQHIQVEESLQGLGIGSQLLVALQRLLLLTFPNKSLYVSFPVAAEGEHPMPFFTKNGFIMRGQASQGFRFSLSALEQNESYQSLKKLPPIEATPLLAMPSSAWTRFKNSFGTSIPMELSPTLVPGTLLPEISLAYLHRGEVVAYVVFSQMSEEVIYLAVSYAKPGYVQQLMGLLRHCFDTLLAKPGSWTTMEIATMNQHSLRLVEHFIGKDESQVQRSHLQLMSWSPEEVRTLTAEHTTKQMDLMLTQSLDADVEFLLPRILRLSDLLALQGYQPSLTVVGDIPGLLFWMDGTMTTMTYSYADEGMSACQLTVLQRMDTAQPESLQQAAVQLFNRTSLHGHALALPGNQVAIRESYLEVDLPISEQTLEVLLHLLQANIATMEGILSPDKA